MGTNNYLKYRGKCKEYVDALCAKDQSLIAVRGHYHCPIWGEQAHWWAKNKNGEIIDLTKQQFPSNGIGEYVEFDGFVNCSECNKKLKEEDASFASNYCFCSTACHMRFVGL